MTFKTVMCCHLYDFFFMSMSPWEQNSEFYYFTLVETWDNLPYENLRSAFEQKGCLSLGWCPERYTCMAEMHTISLNIS